METMDASTLEARFRKARNENEFWLVFEDVCKEALAWPGGLAALSTPSAKMATLFFMPKSPAFKGGLGTVLRQLIDDDGAVYLEQALSTQELGDIRRDVRAGRYKILVRDTRYSWHQVVLGDATGNLFTEPMLPSRELGLAL